MNLQITATKNCISQYGINNIRNDTFLLSVCFNGCHKSNNNDQKSPWNCTQET